MRKEEFIKRYGEAAYEKHLRRNRDWARRNPVTVRANNNARRSQNPDKVKAEDHERNRIGGKYYNKKLKYNRIGIQGERARIRVKHAAQWRPYKRIVAVDSVNHHQWVPGTSRYTGVALIERDRHQHGIINVIRILEGEITLFTEEEIRGAMKQDMVIVDIKT